MTKNKFRAAIESDPDFLNYIQSKIDNELSLWEKYKSPAFLFEDSDFVVSKRGQTVAIVNQCKNPTSVKVYAREREGSVKLVDEIPVEHDICSLGLALTLNEKRDRCVVVTYVHSLSDVTTWVHVGIFDKKESWKKKGFYHKLGKVSSLISEGIHWKCELATGEAILLLVAYRGTERVFKTKLIIGQPK